MGHDHEHSHEIWFNTRKPMHLHVETHSHSHTAEMGVHHEYIELCPRVKQRMACEECGYPFSEARYDTSPDVPHIGRDDDEM